jgi:hypothetical protein
VFGVLFTPITLMATSLGELCDVAVGTDDGTRGTREKLLRKVPPLKVQGKAFLHQSYSLSSSAVVCCT